MGYYFDNIVMNTNSFKSLSDLGKTIEEKVNLIDKGKYSLKEIEGALLEIYELQERLIVLKFKVIEQMAVNLPESQEVSVKEESHIDPGSSVIEKKDKVVSNVNQMTIMDGISEVEKEAEEQQLKHVEEKQGEQIVEQEEKESIAEKMENRAIKDIKSVISINQRVSFTNNLFDGDSENFNHSLEKIEACTSLKEANELLSSFRTANNWENEEVIQEFEEIVSRRFGE